MSNSYNFTARVRKVLALARDEAALLQHEYVGTEHLLLALLREGEGVAATVLQMLDIDMVELRRVLLTNVPKGKQTQAGPDLPYTSRAKKVLELAMSEARALHHSYPACRLRLCGERRCCPPGHGRDARAGRCHGEFEPRFHRH